MIPRTFPSILEDGKTKCVVYVLPSISGLQAWKDYIPVKGVTTENTAVENTYANNGYIVMKTVDGTQKAWIDYLPVYEDASYNKAWSTDAGGYIPASGLFSVRGTLFANSEPGVWYDPSDMTTLFQDSAGTTPVTAVEQPVGRMLDKSGNNLHATQSTSTSRPVLSARYNLLTKTEQFNDAAWNTKTNISVTANGATAPDGTATAEVITATAANGVVGQAFTSVASAYTFSIWLRRVTGTGAIQLNGGGGYVAQTITSTWERYSVTQTLTAGSPTLAIRLVTSGDVIEVWGAQLIVANSLPSNAYQRVDTSTVYDSDATKFPPYLKFDGVDDWLITPTITPGTDKVQVFAGVRKLSDAAAAPVVELSALLTANNGSVSLFAPASSASNIQFATKGTTIAPSTYTNAAVAAPTTDVLTGIGDISGDVSILRVDGVQRATSSADQGTGNYLAYPLYIGRRGGTTLPFNGQLYSLITRFGPNLSTATIQAAEKFVATKTGITI